MLTKSPPFRAAHLRDPYFRRLSAPDKKAFWKIFSVQPVSEYARDLFERMTEKDPKVRINITQIKNHDWLKGDLMDDLSLAEDLEVRSQIIQKLIQESLSTQMQQQMQLAGGGRAAEGQSSSSSSSDEEQLQEEGYQSRHCEEYVR